MKRRAMAMSCRMEPSSERSPLSCSSGLTRRGKAAMATQVRSAAWMRKLPSTPIADYEQAGKEGADDARAGEGGGVQGDGVQQRLSRHDRGDEGLPDDVDDGALDAAYDGEHVEVPHLDVAERDVERKQHGHRRHGRLADDEQPAAVDAVHQHADQGREHEGGRLVDEEEHAQ